MGEVEAWEHVDLQADAEGEGDVHGYAAGEGEGEDAGEGGLEGFRTEGGVEGEEEDFPLGYLGDDVAMG